MSNYTSTYMAHAATEPITLLHPRDTVELRHRVNSGNVIRSAFFLGVAAAIGALAAAAGTGLANRPAPDPHLCVYPVARGDTVAGFADLTGANMPDLRRWNSMDPRATIIMELGSFVAPCVEGAGGIPIEQS